VAGDGEAAAATFSFQHCEEDRGELAREERIRREGDGRGTYPLARVRRRRRESWREATVRSSPASSLPLVRKKTKGPFVKNPLYFLIIAKGQKQWLRRVIK
jgi:hypothetical protein